MRFIFLIPDFDLGKTWKIQEKIAHLLRLKPLQRKVFLGMRTDVVFGGTLNIMRHCWIARNCGAEAVLATLRGVDTYGDRGIKNLPFIPWDARRKEDVCIVPDYVTSRIDEVEGRAIAYLQVPLHTHADFNYQDPCVSLWTDSPHMEAICNATYPGKAAQIVPNIIDPELFPFIPQSQREPGVLFAFPRKNPEFIDATENAYRALGGKYWRIERIDGLSISELAKEFQRPQGFLASAEVEGCALPPQESMASGIVVVGRQAKGANFCMEQGKTAAIAETPQEAAQRLIELENAEVRDRMSRNAYQAISRYFPDREPTEFWQKIIQQYKSPALTF
ncbi:glycosyltransferase [Lusitaniella coriacea LEGE 07157]|uniref:Glycosyltransferase n=1 Tax=Lusitaniella coriacea LEGE 07157 TaxID=945747 RepID=A0A8J7J6M1_9CYAN|nr:glycosyltransferase [Lusitaniella coriacea]MBE9115675.1 glycosyltransferase [Lusitaniella coriacea LEGE 07157]